MRGSTTARLLGLRVRIPPGAWRSLLSVVCCQIEVSVTNRALSWGVLANAVSVCVREAWVMRRSVPTRDCCATCVTCPTPQESVDTSITVVDLNSL